MVTKKSFQQPSNLSSLPLPEAPISTFAAPNRFHLRRDLNAGRLNQQAFGANSVVPSWTQPIAIFPPQQGIDQRIVPVGHGMGIETLTNLQPEETLRRLPVAATLMDALNDFEGGKSMDPTGIEDTGTTAAPKEEESEQGLAHLDVEQIFPKESVESLLEGAEESLDPRDFFDN